MSTLKLIFIFIQSSSEVKVTKLDDSFNHFKYRSKKLSQFKITYISRNSELIQEVKNFVLAWQNEWGFIETKTSGSTGIPKVIRLDKRKMEVSARMTGAYFGFKPNDKVLLCLSPETIGGKMMILRSLLHEMELFVMDVNKNPLEKINFRLKFAAMVPLQIQSVLIINPDKLNLLNQLLIGGANVSQQLEANLKGYATEVFESFGMTETMSHIAVRKLNQPVFQPFEALEGISFDTIDNQLIVNAPNLGIKDLNTNDIVDLVDEKHFYWRGRADFVINSGGIKMYPEKIEKKLSHLIDSKFFIAAEKDELLGEKVIIVIESKRNELLMNRLSLEFKVVLEKFEIPKKIYFKEQFIETLSGKINRKATLKSTLD